jgi:putative hydrolases of HD superfamily
MDKKIVEVLLKTGRLKSIKRSGWVREKMPDPESVAEHTFRICFLVLLLGDELKVDTDKLLRMAIVHDIEEAMTGDPVTQRGKKDVAEHDHSHEKAVVRDLLEGASNKAELFNLWAEHLPLNKPGAPRDVSILYQIGKIATIWQALEYELGGANPNVMDEWWVNAKAHVSEPLFKDLLDL